MNQTLDQCKTCERLQWVPEVGDLFRPTYIINLKTGKKIGYYPKFDPKTEGRKLDPADLPEDCIFSEE